MQITGLRKFIDASLGTPLRPPSTIVSDSQERGQPYPRVSRFNSRPRRTRLSGLQFPAFRDAVLRAPRLRSSKVSEQGRGRPFVLLLLGSLELKTFASGHEISEFEQRAVIEWWLGR